jgi:hypothetical protein
MKAFVETFGLFHRERLNDVPLAIMLRPIAGEEFSIIGAK